MKILLLGNLDSSHIVKWAYSLANREIKLGVFSLNHFDFEQYEGCKSAVFFSSGFEHKDCISNDGSFSKAFYLKALPCLKKAIEFFQPDLIHSHYLSSYGFMGALTLFRPHITSVWGSDIFDFPLNSFFHKFLIKICLRSSSLILSTSFNMANEINKYTEKKVIVTPFGVDINEFSVKPVKEKIFEDNDIVVGTIKTLDPIYGIEYLIRAFELVKKRNRNLPLKLLIVGDGGQRNELQKLCLKLGIEKSVIFVGKIPFREVPKYHNIIDIFVAVSLRESFGVAVVEASSCERPVVVSNVGGLPEIVEKGVTGFIVNPKDVGQTAKAIEELVLNKDLRIRMGKAGRKKVLQNYDWEQNVTQMMGIYQKLLRN